MLALASQVWLPIVTLILGVVLTQLTDASRERRSEARERRKAAAARHDEDVGVARELSLDVDDFLHAMRRDTLLTPGLATSVLTRWSAGDLRRRLRYEVAFGPARAEAVTLLAAIEDLYACAVDLAHDRPDGPEPAAAYDRLHAAASDRLSAFDGALAG